MAFDESEQPLTPRELGLNCEKIRVLGRNSGKGVMVDVMLQGLPIF